MGIKVQVQDFRSLGNTSLEISGFTVIVGKNNLGKSNLWRAIYGAFHNKASGSFIRKDSNSPHCVVDVTFDDGSHIRWEKGDQVNRYCVNGEVLDKVGRGAPDKLQQFGVGPILIAGESWSPQFARQFTGQLFLVDKPGSVLAEAISDVDSVARINGALKLADKDRRLNQTKVKLRKQDLEENQKKLILFEGLGVLEKTFIVLQKRRLLLFTEKAYLQEIGELGGDLLKTKELCESLKETHGLEPPEVVSVVTLGGDLVEAEGLWSSIEDSRTKVSGLEVIRGSELPDVEAILGLSRKYLKMQKEKGKREALLSILLGKEAQGILEIQESLEKLNAEECIKVSKAYVTFKAFLGEMTSYQTSINELQREIAFSKKKLEEAEEDLEELLVELGACPVCGQEVGTEHGLL